jgi:O-antigen/teichoic acid export membrane protein
MANLARLPYQAVISITFVIFPIISQATFVGEVKATRAYVRQTLRYSFMLVSSMAFVLVAMRTQLVEALYPETYAPGVTSLLWLALGMVAFAMTFVGTTILNSAGHPAKSLLVVGGTLAAAAGLNLLFLMTGAVGTPMLSRAALATLLATALGMVAALAIIYHLYRATAPVLTLGRIALAGLAIILTARWVGLVPQPAWLGFSGLVVLTCAWLPIYLMYRSRKKTLTLLAAVSGLIILSGLCYVALALDEHSRAMLLITMVGKMAFLGVLFYALMYMLREFDSEDRDRLLSVFRSRRSPGKEV